MGIFHWYGFIVGCAVCVVLVGLEKLAITTAPKRRLPLSTLQLIVLLILALLGARIWHVVTNLGIYAAGGPVDWWEWVAVWRGGLSILGGVVGLLVGVRLLVPDQRERNWLIDALALWLPIGQAVGRLANWANQELYGLPTNVPWKLFIDAAHRLPGFETEAYFHPLFAYEAIGMLGLAAWMWWRYWRWPALLGSGRLAVWYVLGYSWLRFGLDFFRLDRGELVANTFGINQLFLAIVGSSLTGLAITRWLRRHISAQLAWTVGISTTSLLLGVAISLSQFINAQLFHSSALSAVVTTTSTEERRSSLQLVDHSIVTIGRESTKMTVEVVTTEASRAQGLSGRTKIGEGGMLFIFPQADRWVFWMKDMRFDLDLVWLRQGRIVDVTKHASAPILGTPDSQLKKYFPITAVDMVLELPAGTVEKIGWQIGDDLTISDR